MMTPSIHPGTIAFSYYNQATDAAFQMPSNYLFFLYALFFTTASIACASFVSGALAIGLALLICVVIVLLSFTVRSPNYGATKLRMVALVSTVALAASRGGWSTAVNSAFNSLGASKHLEWLPQWVKGINFTPASTIPELVYSFAVLSVVFYFTRETSSFNSHSASTSSKVIEVPKEEFDAFCWKLRHDLINLDNQSKWDPADYAELEAEVDVRSSHGVVRRKKVLNLQKAIRFDARLQSFLLLGVPGAGKSVALRRLGLYMLEKVNHTKRIPLYVNLREWVPHRIVENGQAKFPFEDLKTFVMESIIKGEESREAFVSQYFDQLWREGRLYFIFDSFDEISEVLDTGQDEKVIDALSELISRFISNDGNSKGILASRIFRRPTKAFQAHKVLEIRPLSESSALEGLSRFAGLSHEKSLELLKQRRDLIPLVRNPFMMVLLGDWIRNHTGLPKNQAQIYESFITKRLEECGAQLTDAGLSTKEVMSLTTDIAWFVFSTASFGLEAPVKDIVTHFNSAKIGFVLEMLRSVGVARVTTGAAPSFAFVHRRFLEYFVTRRLLDDPAKAPILDIPTDSRGRDALVLYAQICEPAEAERIAQLCWNEIKTNFDDESQRMRAIHCLRFLVDAFCFKRDAIQRFGDELHQFIDQHVGSGDNLVFAKICLEATGLLPEIKTAPMLSLALSGGDDWLQETAFKACRYLPRVEKGLQDDIASYLFNIPDLRFWRARKGLLLSLSLSEALKGVYSQARLRVFNLMVSLGAALMLLPIAPKGLAVGGFYAIFCLMVPQGAAEVLMKNNKRKPGDGSNQQQKHKGGSKWLSAGVLERALAVCRYTTVGGLVVFCMTGLVGLLPKPEKGAICIVGWCGFDPLLYQVVCLALAISLLDWIVAYKALCKLLPQLLTLKFWAFAVGVVVLCGASMLVMVFLVNKYADYIGYMNYAYAILVGGILVFGLACAARVWWRQYKDRKLINEFKFSNEITRMEIEHTLSRMLTGSGKMYYVRCLEKNQVKAVGQWPEPFKLSVGQGDAVTALARLEERWLGLDR
ncbi:NACHT domain-containing protein [Pseudomonas syringae]|uniref:NACHT domain-containing protein n=1 Tax=Pseudomonas syringae TaxID=317 RepID=UPI0023F6AFA3|nr:NACHT domain-containing protein [Pseudomonas syringae]MDF5890349.1 NACHT domain-containing protein [Pseudomonas syringae pv. syringae]